MLGLKKENNNFNVPISGLKNECNFNDQVSSFQNENKSIKIQSSGLKNENSHLNDEILTLKKET
jgi:hypothetical protein